MDKLFVENYTLTTGKKVLLPHAQFLALVYHDLFDYPLTRDELLFWQIGSCKDPRFTAEIKDGFSFLPTKSQNVYKRTAKAVCNENKYKIAQGAAHILSFLPTIEFIGLSGSVSMANATDSDDIDLMIITKQNTLWATRLIVFLLLWAKKISLRRRLDTEFKDKLCLNLWLTENNLSFANRQDIYTAHEILQIKALFDRKGIFKKLLDQNRWVAQFFPNAYKKRTAYKPRFSKETRRVLEQILVVALGFILKLFEPVAHFWQIKRMAPFVTTEQINRSQAKFHPLPWQETVPQVFLARLERLAKTKTEFAKQIFLD